MAGLALAAVLLGSSPATAEIPLAQYHGWHLTTDGRVESLVSIVPAGGIEGSPSGSASPSASLLAGSDNDLSRGGLLVDMKLAHEYGLGYPCSVRDASGSACGMAGFGAPFPWYNPGFIYSTPRLGGLQFSLGAYDPATIDDAQLDRTPLPRFEGEVKFDFKKVAHVFTSGFWQVVEGTVQETNAATGMQEEKDLHTDAWGAQAGGMVSFGSISVGGAAFAGTGYSPIAAQSQLSADSSGVLRNSRGAFGLGSVLIAGPRLKIAGGLGVWHLDKNKDEAGFTSATGSPTNPQLIKENLGMTIGIYHTTEPVHFALEYFRAQHTWYDRGVASATDPTVTVGVITPQQIVNFVNAGMTVVW